ncbi:MAG TPA: amidase [Solirubrobacterales bacterium]
MTLSTDSTRRTFLVRSGAAVAATSTLGALLASRAKATVPSTGLPTVAEVLAQDRALYERDIIELATLLQAGEVTSVEVTETFIERIEALNGPFESYAPNGGLNAFVRIDEAGALADAAAADTLLAEARAGGAPAPLLCGIPLGFQDVIAVEGLALQNGTAAFAGNFAEQDAVPVERLREVGTVQLGIANCAPFSQRVAGAPAGAYTTNPWDATKETGGPADGPNVAAIGRLAAGALAVDTAGGAIVPAAIVGASAILPSVGLVPTGGVMPDVPGVDAVVPVSTSVAGASLVLNTMLGPDLIHDPVSNAAPAEFPLIPISPRATDKPLAGTTIGLPTNDWLEVDGTVEDGIAPASLWSAGPKAAFERFVGELEALGATVKEVEVLDLASAANDYIGSTEAFTTVKVEISENVYEEFTLTPEEVVAESVRNEVRYTEAVSAFAAESGRTTAQVEALTSYFGRGATPALATALKLEKGVTWGARIDAEKRRRELAVAAREALAAAGVDFLAVMTYGGPPVARGAALSPLRAYLGTANALGWPLVNLPIGEAEGNPVSAALWGPRFSDPELIQTAVDYQAAHPEWHTRIPTGAEIEGENA